MEKYLPIGSVVLLKNGKKRLFIAGFGMKEKDKEKIYDYCGYPYPEGVANPNQTVLFDHTEIEKIFFLGYSDLEEEQFKEKLKEMLQNK